VLEVFAGEGIRFMRESAHEHPLDFRLPGQFLELLIVKEFFRAGDVILVQFDPDATRKFIPPRDSAGETDELGFGNRHALTLEGQIDRVLLDDGIYTKKPGGIVHRLN
jgi:hypothetical protein